MISMKKWETPKVNELEVQATNEDASTFDLPHTWECQKCGKHYIFKPDKCDYNGCGGQVFERKWLEPEHLKS